MRELYSSAPRSELRAYVRAFAQRKLDETSPEVVQPIPAGLEHTLEFEFGELPIIECGDGSRLTTYEVVLVGASAYRPANIRLRAGLESFAIFFQPLAFCQLFRVPVGKLVNRHYDCCDVIGVEIKRLRDRMADTDCFYKRVEFVEEYLLTKAKSSMGNTPVMDAAHYMSESRGTARVGHVADQASLGLRQFERRFASEMGISPKVYARVARFQTALDAKVSSQNVPWVKLAHKFGYHDQMHMIRDFQDLSGLTPTSLLECLGDMRPPALAASGNGIKGMR